jgi:hypothetical protein
MGDFLYISVMKNLFRNIFGKKEVTKDDKMVNLIVKFIKVNYNIAEYYNSEESSKYWLMKFRPSNDWYVI